MILTAAEARVALGLTTIVDLDRALIEMLLPKIDAAIASEIKYDPQYKQYVEWYPRMELMNVAGQEGVWDTSGKTAFFGTINRASTLQLAALPVRKIDEVRVDYIGGFGQKANSFTDDKVWALGTQWWQDLTAQGKNETGHVFSIGGWPREPGSVKVTYWAGYSEDELLGRASQGPNNGDVAINASGIKNAAMLTMVKAFKTVKAHGLQGRAGMAAGPITSERLQDYQYSTSEGLISAVAGMQISVPSEAKQNLAPFVHFGLVNL
jgi:hypothetical protein